VSEYMRERLSVRGKNVIKHRPCFVFRTYTTDIFERDIELLRSAYVIYRSVNRAVKETLVDVERGLTGGTDTTSNRERETQSLKR
jgi:hypothetical protein